jgi:RND superfamily putative drug exporter
VAVALGRIIYRLRWVVIGAWLIVFVLAAFLAPHVTSVLKGGGYNIPSSQSDRAYTVLSHAFGYKALTFTAVFSGKSKANPQQLLQSANMFRQRLQAHFDSAVEVSAPRLSSNGRIAFVRIYMKPRADFAIPLTQPVRSLLPHVPGIAAYLTGPSAIFHDMEQVSDADLHRAEVVTFPVALVILLIIFGTALGALMPVSMGPLTVTIALALIYLLGQHITMSIFVLNTASMLGLGVAIDYSLFMVNRFREELQQGRDVESAIGHTVATAGRAILFSALTVATGFLGMTLLRVSMLTSLGIGGSLVVALSLLAALTFLPALLGILGPRINWLSVTPRWLSTGTFWQRLAHFVMRRPWFVIVGVVAVVIVFALPARQIRVGVPGSAILPQSSQSRQGDELLTQNLGLANQSPVLLVLRSKDGFAKPATRIVLLMLAGQICQQPIVAGVASAPTVNSPAQIVPCQRALQLAQRVVAQQSQEATATTMRVVLVSIFLKVDPSSAAAESFVRYLRHLTPPPGVQILVGGQTAGQLDFDNYLYAQFPKAILFVISVILLILAIAFRSVLLPIKAVLMNVLSVLATYGATVFVFQQGHFHGFFGFTPTGYLDSIVPIFLFCVLFGLSTDYEVFLLTRVHEEFIATGDNTHSVALGLERTGRIITSAALIMLVVFSAFAFANLVVIKQLGFAMAVGVFVDSTLIRALLVPAAMRIFGTWNWWPAHYQQPAPLPAIRDLAS